MMTQSAHMLDRLHAAILAKRDADPVNSYTARLLGRGTAKIAQKLGEEAVEAVIEAVRGDRGALVGESADLLYHLLVLWADAGIAPDDIWEELRRREGISGIAEKKSRPKSGRE
jgi:phosphoribosyl-ATP pyrophosphohydrolase